MKHRTHQELLDILEEVDNAPVEVSDWEAEFIGKNLDARSFTRKQKQIIQDLEEKYLK